MEDATLDDTVLDTTPFDPSVMFGPQGPTTTHVDIELREGLNVILTITTDGPDTTVTGKIDGEPDTLDELEAAVEILKRLL